MKITITYRPGEERAAGELLAALRQLYPRGKVRKSDRYAPVMHLYFAVKVPLETAENLEAESFLQGEGRGINRKRETDC